MSHYEQRLEADLAHIRKRVMDLADLVEHALRNATDALLSGDEEKAYATVLGDHPINRISREVDRLCHAFIARHLPGAGHLRLMSSVIRVNVALERIGDYAVTICRESVQLSSPPEENIARQLFQLAEEAQGLLSQSIAAFNESNAEQARSLMPVTDRVEAIMDGIYDELIDSGRNREPRETVADFVVFNLFKRISDQAKNICDQTVFAVDGEGKAAKVFNILFIDESNSILSPMAEALAGKRFPDVAHYASAGRNPAASRDPILLQFLESRGVDTANNNTQSIESLLMHLPNYDVIVVLEGRGEDFFEKLPFHSAVLNWNLDASPSGSDEEQVRQRFEEIYRELVSRIDGLMHKLIGDSSG